MSRSSSSSLGSSLMRCDSLGPRRVRLRLQGWHTQRLGCAAYQLVHARTFLMQLDPATRMHRHGAGGGLALALAHGLTDGTQPAQPARALEPAAELLDRRRTIRDVA